VDFGFSGGIMSITIQVVSSLNPFGSTASCKRPIVRDNILQIHRDEDLAECSRKKVQTEDFSFQVV
jgi:hypothetical protein